MTEAETEVLKLHTRNASDGQHSARSQQEATKGFRKRSALPIS